MQSLGLLFMTVPNTWASLWLSCKESTSKAGAIGDAGLVPGSGRSPGGGHGTHSSILAWRIPWTEEAGGLRSTGPEESDTAEATQHACMNPNAHHCPRRRADTQQAFLEWVL